MKLIFLDIDGVLNSDTWERSLEFKTGKYPHNQFDPKLISLFNKIIARTNAKVVLASSWRIKHDIAFMQKLFSELGIKGEIIDATPNLQNDNDYVVRGNEILKWCKDNEELLGIRYIDYTDFAIIDDNSDMLLWQAKYFFKTDRLSGLTPSVAREIIRQLK